MPGGEHYGASTNASGLLEGSIDGGGVDVYSVAYGSEGSHVVLPIGGIYGGQ